MRYHSEIQEMGNYRFFIDRSLIWMFGTDESMDNRSSILQSRPIL